MNNPLKVLHLSLVLAMTLPAFGAMAAGDEVVPAGDAAQTQIAAGKGGGQPFTNAGEADKLRHRVNEPDKEQAQRNRLEKQTGDEDALKQQDRLREQDRLKEQDQLKEQDRLRERDQLKEQDRLKDRDRQSGTPQQSGTGKQVQNQYQHIYRFQNGASYESGSAGQGFDGGGSMFQRMGGGNPLGSGLPSAGRSAAGGGGRR